MLGLGLDHGGALGFRVGGEPGALGVCVEEPAQRGRVTGRGQLTAELLLALLGGRDPIGRLGHRGARRRGGLRDRRGVGRCLDTREPTDLPVELAERLDRRRRGAARAGQLGHDPVDVGADRAQRRHPLGRVPQRSVVGADHAGEELVGRGELRVTGHAEGVGAFADATVDVQAEQVDQDALPLGGLGVQERGELALRQHHALGELLVRQADDVLHGGVDLGGRAGEHVTHVLCGQSDVKLGEVEAVRERFETRVPRVDGALGVAADHAAEHIARAGRLEHQANLRLGGGRGECVGDRAAVAPARDGAVEREDHRIEHGRLAGAGRPDEREEVGVGEVDGGRLAKHREPVEIESQRPHDCALASLATSSWRRWNSETVASSACPRWVR